MDDGSSRFLTTVVVGPGRPSSLLSALNTLYTARMGVLPNVLLIHLQRAGLGIKVRRYEFQCMVVEPEWFDRAVSARFQDASVFTYPLYLNGAAWPAAPDLVNRADSLYVLSGAIVHRGDDNAGTPGVQWVRVTNTTGCNVRVCIGRTLHLLSAPAQSTLASQ